MSITIADAANHTPSLFAAVLAAVFRTFDVLHDAQWRAPWDRA